MYKLLQKEVQSENNLDSSEKENLFSFKNIGNVIQYLMGNFYFHHFSNNSKFKNLTKFHIQSIFNETDNFGKVKILK